MRTFRELKVWQQAHDLTLTVYKAVVSFPPHEQYGLMSQMRRAAVSIAANIVEGHKRQGRREFLNFLSVAESSLEELKYHLLLAHDLQYLAPSAFGQLYQRAELVGKMLNRLRWHIKQEVRNGKVSRPVPTSA